MGFNDVIRKVFCIPPPITRTASPGIPPSLASGGSDSNLAGMVSRRSSVRKPDDHSPVNQPHYVFHNGTWMKWSTYPHRREHTSPKVEILWLITWNIEYKLGSAEPRMAAALAHLEQIVANIPAHEPVVILLQEMIESDLEQIQAAPWVRERFFLTDVDSNNWRSEHYGTTTLVDRSLNIRSVFRVPWVSKFDRDGLFVDLDSGPSSSRILRICNTHLESLVAEPPVRPQQVKAAAKFLFAEQVGAGFIAGDFNAIQPFDRFLHSENKLKDVYLELGGEEDSDEGFTWGYQSPAESRKFGYCRMDKVLYCGAVRPIGLDRLGVGVRAPPDPNYPDERGQYVTDHYGLLAKMQLLERKEGNVFASLGVADAGAKPKTNAELGIP